MSSGTIDEPAATDCFGASITPFIHNLAMANTDRFTSLFDNESLANYMAEFFTYQELIDISCTAKKMYSCTRKLLRNKREMKCLSFISESFPSTSQQTKMLIKQAVLCDGVKLFKWDTAMRLQAKQQDHEGPPEYCYQYVLLQNAGAIRQIQRGLEQAMQCLSSRWIGHCDDSSCGWECEQVNFPQHFAGSLCSNSPSLCVAPLPQQKTLYFYLMDCPPLAQPKKFCQHCVANSVLLQLKIARSQRSEPFVFKWAIPNRPELRNLIEKSSVTANDIIFKLDNDSGQLYYLVFSCNE